MHNAARRTHRQFLGLGDGGGLGHPSAQLRSLSEDSEAPLQRSSWTGGQVGLPHGGPVRVRCKCSSVHVCLLQYPWAVPVGMQQSALQPATNSSYFPASVYSTWHMQLMPLSDYFPHRGPQLAGHQAAWLRSPTLRWRGRSCSTCRRRSLNTIGRCAAYVHHLPLHAQHQGFTCQTASRDLAELVWRELLPKHPSHSEASVVHVTDVGFAWPLRAAMQRGASALP